MANPITWQSLSNHNLPDPTRLMALGQESMNAGMAGFQKMADNYLQGQQNIADKAKVDNLASLKQGLFGKTVAELEADQASGAYGQRIAGFGKNVDALAAQAFMEERLSKVKQNDTANWAYQNAATDQAQAPVRDELLAAINRNDPLTANIIKSGNPTLRNMAAIEAEQVKVQRQATADFQNTTKFDNEQLMAPLDRAAREASTAASKAQAAAAGAQVEVAQGKLEDDRTARAAAKLKASFDARTKGTMFEEGQYSPTDSVELGDLLAKNEGIDAGERSRVLERINKLASEGVPVSVKNGDKTETRNVPIPKSLIKGLIMGARDDEYVTAPWNWSEAPANFIEKRLKAAMNATETFQDGEGNTRVRSPALDGYNLLLSAQQAAIENPVAGGSAGPKAPGAYKSPKPSKPKKD